MKNSKWVTGVMAVLFIFGVCSTAYCDTIFVGSRPGVLRLNEDMQFTGVTKNIGYHVKHLVIADTGNIYCALPGKVAIFNATTFEQIESLPVSGDICKIELKNGKVHVLTKATDETGSGSKVYIIDNLQITKEIDAGLNPADMAVDSGSNCMLYITKESESKIDVISAATGKLIKSMNCGGSPCSVALNDAGTKLYVLDGEVSEIVVLPTGGAYNIDLVQRIPVGQNCRKLRSGGMDIYAIDSSSETKAVYVINTSSDTVTHTIQLDAVPCDVVLSPDGDYMLIASAAADKMYKVVEYAVVKEKNMPQPYEITITPETIIISVTEPGLPEGEAAGVLDGGIILAGDALALDLISPDGGELWRDVQDVIWIGGNDPAAYVQYTIDGTNYYPLHAGSVPNEGWFQWHTNILPNIDNTNYKVKVIVGAESDVSLSNFLVDNTPPICIITDPKEKDTVNGSTTVTVKITASDNLSGLSTPVKVKVTRGGGTIVNNYNIYTQTAGQYVTDVTIDGEGRSVL